MKTRQVLCFMKTQPVKLGLNNYFIVTVLSCLLMQTEKLLIEDKVFK